MEFTVEWRQINNQHVCKTIKQFQLFMKRKKFKKKDTSDTGNVNTQYLILKNCIFRRDKDFAVLFFKVLC